MHHLSNLISLQNKHPVFIFHSVSMHTLNIPMRFLPIYITKKTQDDKNTGQNL